MDLIILIPLGLVALVGAYLCYHFIFHRNEPHDFWSHTSKVDPDDSHMGTKSHIYKRDVSKEIIALSITAVLVIGIMGYIVYEITQINSVVLKLQNNK